ncbi:enolase C-terminal domain-like protein [Kribbella sp. NPDC059898]|uniref:enolase C-terminal domain-like protein n=1 Tax=Kribbella sp. NPDC059898 TaxID=3346995 RepID=UPI00365980D2
MDRIRQVRLSSVVLPLRQAISDAKVLTGRQRPMTEVVFLFAEIATDQDQHGIGFSYSKRAGGPAQYAHAKEIAGNLIGEDPSDIGKVYDKLLWAGASVGRSGVATQAIAAIDIALWDLKAKRAGLPLAKLLGAHRDSVRAYNTSGGFLHAPIDEVLENASKSLADGIGGITPFLKLATLADHNGLQLAPHFAMEIHLHLAAAYPREPWVEHFEWLNPLFNERLETVDGRMLVPDRPGLGFTTSEQCARWTVDSCEFT